MASTTITKSTAESAKFSGKDVLVLPDGSVYHLGVKPGETHARVITVGSHSRADLLGELLDKSPAPVKKTSDRLFHIISGNYKGVGITIVAIGMGAPMADFLLRELSFVNPAPMAVVRIGTCGILDPKVLPGTVMVATEGSSYVYRNYAYFDGCLNDDTQDGKKAGVKPYLITKPVPGDAGLTALMLKHLKGLDMPTATGMNVAGETFYSCQGRNDPNFIDDNTEIMDVLEKANAVSMEMETHQLFHLAKLRTCGPCLAAGCAVGIVSRNNPNVGNITADQLEKSQTLAGTAVMEALVELKLPTATK
eukprot:GHVS01043876.1.p1 GENE.GHVS01043876.1~~GHVS01043876.1.p1  ORF type:complete len:307 (+),score=43.85 GHVS01043876.1:97-1017(+)